MREIKTTVKCDRFADRGDCHKVALVCSTNCIAPHYFVSFGEHVVNRGMNVWVTGTEYSDELLESFDTVNRPGGIMQKMFSEVHFISYCQVSIVPGYFNPPLDHLLVFVNAAFGNGICPISISSVYERLIVISN